MRENTIAVLGLGYVGLPVAAHAGRAGFKVIGFDTSQAVVDSLNAGISHVDDIDDKSIDGLLNSGFIATRDPKALANAEIFVICVPTPLTAHGGPDLNAVKSAGAVIAEVLKVGDLVILESTTYPGTTDSELRPILESTGLIAGEDFALCFSPERIDPGNSRFTLANTPKVVGGLTEECLTRGIAFYSTMVERVVPARGLREAEMAKLLENTYRHVNIALVNEMARFSADLGIDLWDVIECASTKPFGFQAFYPGPGVGGHCIPIDPNYLSHYVRESAGYSFRFVELAQEINASMPAYVAKRITDLLVGRGVSVSGASVILLGVTYKTDVADTRESPAADVARALRAMGAIVTFHDPYIQSWSIDGIDVPRLSDPSEGVSSSDASVLLQAHSTYDVVKLAREATLLLDTRGVTPAGLAVRL